MMVDICYSSPSFNILFLLFQQVVDGARVRNWVCINFCRDLHMNIVHKFCADLVKTSCTTGVVIYVLKLFHFVFYHLKILLYDC
jgi:hypothetical protein